jgi:hypothetical protein
MIEIRRNAYTRRSSMSAANAFFCLRVPLGSGGGIVPSRSGVLEQYSQPAASLAPL